MFDLNKSIAQWRRQMITGGIKTPAVLDELESHLREDVEQQVRTGCGVQQALEISVARIGNAALIKNEFRKIGTIQRRNMIRSIAIILALFGMVFGLAMILPALGQWSRTGVLHGQALAMGVALVIAGGMAAFYGIRTHKETRGRKAITLAIIGAGIFYALPFILAFFQNQKTGLAGWLFCALLALISVVFFGSCFRLNRRIPV